MADTTDPEIEKQVEAFRQKLVQAKLKSQPEESTYASPEAMKRQVVNRSGTGQPGMVYTDDGLGMGPNLTTLDSATKNRERVISADEARQLGETYENRESDALKGTMRYEQGQWVGNDPDGSPVTFDNDQDAENWLGPYELMGMEGQNRMRARVTVPLRDQTERELPPNRMKIISDRIRANEKSKDADETVALVPRRR